jgi:hypothetical protein
MSPSEGKTTTDHDEIRRWVGRVVAKFDQGEPRVLYQEHKASGEDSTFFKLVRR